MPEIVKLVAVDAAGVLWPIELRLGAAAVARVELVGQGVFGSDDDDYLSCLLAVRRHLEERGGCCAVRARGPMCGRRECCGSSRTEGGHMFSTLIGGVVSSRWSISSIRLRRGRW